MLGNILIQFDPGLRAEGLMCNNFQFKPPSQDHGCKERRGEGSAASPLIKEPVAKALSQAPFECKCGVICPGNLPCA